MKKIFLILTILSISAFAVLACVYLYFWWQQESTALNDDFRKNEGSTYITLSSGVTRYLLLNTRGKETIVLIPGAGIGYDVWEKVAKNLSSSGYKVISFDFYGRGYSDRIKSNYSSEVFLQQTVELIDSLHLGGKIHLAGFSIGAITAIDYALAYPERIASFILVDPAALNRGIKWFYKMPLISDFLMTVYYMPRASEKQFREFYKPDSSYKKLVEQQTKPAGFKRSQLLTWQNFITQNRKAEIIQLGRLNFPKLIVWGKNDTMTGLDQSEYYLEHWPETQLNIIDSCGHPAPYEQPDRISACFIKFLDNL